MQELWDFGGRAILIVVLCSALFGAVVGYALASWGQYSRVVGVLAGVIFSIPGIVGLAIASIVRVSSARVTATAPPRPAATKQLEPSYSESDSFSEPSGFGAPGPAAPASTGFGFATFDTATGYSFGTIESSTTSAEPPIPALAQRKWDWIRSRAGIRTTAAAGIAGGLLAATLLAAWLSVDAGIIPRFWFYPLGTGLDLAVLVGVLLVALVVLTVAIRPMRWAAILLAVVGDFWLLFALMTISARESVARVLGEVGALSLTVGDTLKAFGITPQNGVFELPPGIDLSSLGIPGNTISVGAVELGTVIPDVALDLGPGIFMLVAFGALANVAVMLILLAAHNATIRRAAASAEAI